MKPRAIVTGASSGIGYETAKLLCEEGWQVLSVARRFEQLENLEEQSSPGIIPFPIDVCEPNAAVRIIRAAEERLGGLDLLVNNAGPAWCGPFPAMPTDEIDLLINTDFRALILLCRTAIPLLECGGHGQIINVGSVAAYDPMASMAVYSAIKAAVVAFSEALNKELADKHIRVNVLSPSGTDTEIFDQVGLEDVNREKLIAPADMAKLILMLVNLPPSLDVGELATHHRYTPPM